MSGAGYAIHKMVSGASMAGVYGVGERESMTMLHRLFEQGQKPVRHVTGPETGRFQGAHARESGAAPGVWKQA